MILCTGWTGPHAVNIFKCSICAKAEGAWWEERWQKCGSKTKCQQLGFRNQPSLHVAIIWQMLQAWQLICRRSKNEDDMWGNLAWGSFKSLNKSVTNIWYPKLIKFRHILCEQEKSQVTTFGRQKDTQRNHIYVYTHIHIYVMYIHIYKSVQKGN